MICRCPTRKRLTLGMLESEAVENHVLGYQPTIPERERFIGEDSTSTVIKIVEVARGTATRHSAAQVRNMTESLQNQTAGRITLDFEGVPVVSIGFAGELVGRLISGMDAAKFVRTVEVKNANALVQRLIDRAIDSRSPNRSRPQSTSAGHSH